MELLRLEEYVFEIGSWSSLQELEDSITLHELHRLFLAQQRKEYREKRFLAALNGVEMPEYDDPDYKDVPTFSEVTERAKQRQMEFFGKAASTGQNDLTASCFDIGLVS